VNREQSAFLLGGVVLGLIAGLLIGLVILREPVAAPALAGGAPGMDSATGGEMPPAGARGTTEGGSGSAPAPATGGMDPGATGAAVMGEVMQTLQNLKSTVEKNPNDLQALTQLGDMYFDAGKYEESRGWYERAASVNPKDPQLVTALGLTELNLGKPQVALERCRQALAIDPKFWPAAAYSVIAAVEMGDKTTARSSLDSLRTLNPGFEHMADFEQRVAAMGGASGAPAAPPAS
jgi:hypothetical protein